MIVVDTSAIIAILFEEADKRTFAKCMTDAERVLVSAATLTETGIVAYSKLGNFGSEKMTAIIHDLEMQLHAVDEQQSILAIDAYKRFGRGTGHPARLNFGDCFSYALAKALDLPLLFKGDDFTHSDIAPALLLG